MKAVVLSGVPTGHASMSALASIVQSELRRAGYQEVRNFDLAEARLAFCQGEFDCWLKTPGRCKVDDAETEIVRAVHDADALVLLGPVTFGGHGYVLKRAVDRLICLTEPFFTKRASLTHHLPRYAHAASLFSVGWASEPSAAVAETFVGLNDANAINFFAPRCGALVLDDTDRDEWPAALAVMLETARPPGEAVGSRALLREALFAATAPGGAELAPERITRAALLVGSAKPKGTSASETIARALAGRLERMSVTTELHFATEFVHDDPYAIMHADAIAACDLFALVTPLYVDSLPALATHALELIARSRRRVGAPARCVAIVNCGFPEAEQNRTALRIARHFSTDAHYAWGGGLALGAGGVVSPGVALGHPHGPVAHVVRALDMAAPALAIGDPLPLEAIDAMAEAPLPDALYRVIGDLGFRWQAHANGLSQAAIHARPFDAARST